MVMHQSGSVIQIISERPQREKLLDYPTRTYTARALPEKRTTHNQLSPAQWVIVGAWLASAINEIFDSQLFFGLLMIVCAHTIINAIFANHRVLAKPKSGWPFFTVLAPFVFMLLDTLIRGDAGSQIRVVMGIMTVIAFWVARPKISDLKILAWLGGITAALSIAFAIVAPTVGLMVEADTARFHMPEKALWFSTILSGFYPTGNTLAIVLALSLCSVFLLKSLRSQVYLTAIIGFTLVWTSSRSVLAGCAVAVAFAILVRFKPRSRYLPFGLSIAWLVVPFVPLYTNTLTAFTGRGRIWLLSLDAFVTKNHTNLGLGNSWFSETTLFPHIQGHNFFIQTLLIGGIGFVLLSVNFVIQAIRGATSLEGKNKAYGFVFLGALAPIFTLEGYTFGIFNHHFFVIILPLTCIIHQLATSGRSKNDFTNAAITEPRLPYREP